MRSKLLIITLTIYLGFTSAHAQGLLDELYFEEKDRTELVQSTFKMLRIGMFHSVETRKKGVVELTAYTRYWNIPEVDGEVIETNNFASDRMSARFGADIAFTNQLTVGIGWSNTNALDGYFKYRIVQQRSGKKSIPFSITGLLGGSHRFENLQNISSNGDPTAIYDTTVPNTSINLEDGFGDKTNIYAQLLFARKFDRNLSLQVSPTLIFRGSNRFEENPDVHVALGFGGRYKVGKHASLFSEYYWLPKSSALQNIETFGAYSLGVNWEVSKVQIQMFLTNSGDYAEDITITETPVNFNFKDGNLFFGWNFAYVLHFKKRKK
ncbi:DUF5777 family beta-barrel protein [Aquimarina agarivorans]|uniref:DUF5777 family beta-barrel protein n=1 Tax=Aquimarina agarivorans TaxID=980584 RepID=UPI000248F284|nr:DUF5777 family beta-barrel protein [Aquimarina agarivorans]